MIVTGLVRAGHTRCTHSSCQSAEQDQVVQAHSSAADSSPCAFQDTSATAQGMRKHEMRCVFGELGVLQALTLTHMAGTRSHNTPGLGR